MKIGPVSVSRSVNQRLDQTLVEVLTQHAMHDRGWMNDVPEHKRNGDVKRWNGGARRRIDEKTRPSSRSTRAIEPPDSTNGLDSNPAHLHSFNLVRSRYGADR